MINLVFGSLVRSSSAATQTANAVEARLGGRLPFLELLLCSLDESKRLFLSTFVTGW